MAACILPLRRNRSMGDTCGMQGKRETKEIKNKLRERERESVCVCVCV